MVLDMGFCEMNQKTRKTWWGVKRGMSGMSKLGDFYRSQFGIKQGCLEGAGEGKKANRIIRLARHPSVTRDTRYIYLTIDPRHTIVFNTVNTELDIPQKRWFLVECLNLGNGASHELR